MLDTLYTDILPKSYIGFRQSDLSVPTTFFPGLQVVWGAIKWVLQCGIVAPESLYKFQFHQVIWGAVKWMLQYKC